MDRHMKYRSHYSKQLYIRKKIFFLFFVEEDIDIRKHIENVAEVDEHGRR